MPKLESEVVRSIRALCEHGDTLVKMKEYSFAISKYYEALSLIPDPKEDYKPSAWIYTSMGETYWKMKDYNNAGTTWAFPDVPMFPEPRLNQSALTGDNFARLVFGR